MHRLVYRNYPFAAQDQEEDTARLFLSPSAYGSFTFTSPSSEEIKPQSHKPQGHNLLLSQSVGIAEGMDFMIGEPFVTVCLDGIYRVDYGFHNPNYTSFCDSSTSENPAERHVFGSTVSLGLSVNDMEPSAEALPFLKKSSAASGNAAHQGLLYGQGTSLFLRLYAADSLSLKTTFESNNPDFKATHAFLTLFRIG